MRTIKISDSRFTDNMTEAICGLNRGNSTPKDLNDQVEVANELSTVLISTK